MDERAEVTYKPLTRTDHVVRLSGTDKFLAVGGAWLTFDVSAMFYSYREASDFARAKVPDDRIEIIQTRSRTLSNCVSAIVSRNR